MALKLQAANDRSSLRERFSGSKRQRGEELAESTSEGVELRAVAVEPRPHREFHEAWMLDPTDDTIFERIADHQEGSDTVDSVFSGLHFFQDYCLTEWSGRAEDRYGFNTLTASYRALRDNGTFEMGDEWRDEDPGFYAAAYVSLWYVQHRFQLDEIVGEHVLWKQGTSGIVGGGEEMPYLEDWYVSAQDHMTLMRIAEEPENWNEYFSEYRGLPNHHYPPVLVPFMDGYSFRPTPTLKLDGNGDALAAAIRLKESCPFWVPRVVMAGITPELSWTPNGITAQERMKSLLRCVTQVVLEVPHVTDDGRRTSTVAEYNLKDLSIVGTERAYEAYRAWWISQNFARLDQW